MKCAHVNTKRDLEQLIESINNNTFDYEEIQIHNLNSINEALEFNDQDLQKLITAINVSHWCQEHLQELNLSNNQFSIMPDLRCENLARLVISGTPFENIGRIDCPHLVSLKASHNNSRVPPNLTKYPQLKELEILQANPLSLLGIYALLLQLNQKNLLEDQPYKGLAEKFIKVASHTPLSQITLSFAELPYDPEDEESTEKTNISEFLNNFKIPEFFLIAHVAFVISFMQRTYHIEPPADYADSQAQTKTFNQSRHLKTLNQEYIKGIRIFGAYINGLLARPIHHKNILTPDNIIKVARANAPTTHLPNFASHTEFFSGQLQKDFATLKEIFIAANKPEHAKLISKYEVKHRKDWVIAFNTKEFILEKCKSCLRPANVTLEVNTKKPARSWLNYFKIKKSAKQMTGENSNPVLDIDSTASRTEKSTEKKRRSLD